MYGLHPRLREDRRTLATLVQEEAAAEEMGEAEEWQAEPENVAEANAEEWVEAVVSQGPHTKTEEERRMWLRAEQIAAQALNVRWQDRGPPGPSPGAPATERWRGSDMETGQSAKGEQRREA
jgi:hypothetical protein